MLRHDPGRLLVGRRRITAPAAASGQNDLKHRPLDTGDHSIAFAANQESIGNGNAEHARAAFEALPVLVPPDRFGAMNEHRLEHAIAVSQATVVVFDRGDWL